MTLLSYNGKYVISSTGTVTASSNSLVDDTQASQTFTLTESKTVLVIYTANAAHGDTNAVGGIRNAISVDGTDHAVMHDSGYAANYAVRNCCVWVGTLAAGEHTIKGRFGSNVASTNTRITNRTLLIYLFTGDEYRYIEDSNAITTAGTSYITDDYSSDTVIPSGDCKALIFYGATNEHGTTERYVGKKAAIQINEVNYDASEARKSSYNASNYSDSLVSVYAAAFSGSTNYGIAGLIAGNSTQTVTVSKRFTAILLFDNSTTLDLVSSVTQVSNTSTSFADDTQATITRNTSGELLAIGQATKYSGNAASLYGLAYCLNIDSSDLAISRSSGSYTADAVGSLHAYGTTVTSGSHTVKGRLATNNSTTAAEVDTRILIALWFTPVQINKTFSSNNDLMLSKPFSSSLDLKVNKPFSATNDVGLSKPMSSSNDLRLSKPFSATNDARLNKSFAGVSDVLLTSLKLNSNDVKVNVLKQSTNDVLAKFSFTNNSDIRLSLEFLSNNAIQTALLVKIFSSDNNVNIEKQYASSSDVSVKKLFSNTTDVRLSKTYLSMNDVLRSLRFYSANSIMSGKTFNSSNDVRQSKQFASSNDIAALLSKLFSSINDIQTSLRFGSSSDIHLIKIFESDNEVVYIDFDYDYPLTVVIVKNVRKVVCESVHRDAIPHNNRKTATLSPSMRTATVCQRDRGITLW